MGAENGGQGPEQGSARDEAMKRTTSEGVVEAGARGQETSEDGEGSDQELERARETAKNIEGLTALSTALGLEHPTSKLAKSLTAKISRGLNLSLRQSVRSMELSNRAVDSAEQAELVQAELQEAAHRAQSILEELDHPRAMMVWALAFEDAGPVNEEAKGIYDKWMGDINEIGGLDYLRKFFPDIDRSIEKEKQRND